MPPHDLDFRWNQWNRDQVEKHGLTPAEVEHVVRFARHPFPRRYDRRQSWQVVGRTPSQRRINVLYFIDDYDFIFVFHAQ